MKIRVDPERCVGHAMCAAVAPSVYELDDIGSCASDGAEVRSDRTDAARAGRLACPEQAITLLDDDHG